LSMHGSRFRVHRFYSLSPQGTVHLSRKILMCVHAQVTSVLRWSSLSSITNKSSYQVILSRRYVRLPKARSIFCAPVTSYPLIIAAGALPGTLPILFVSSPPHAHELQESNSSNPGPRT